MPLQGQPSTKRFFIRHLCCFPAFVMVCLLLLTFSVFFCFLQPFFRKFYSLFLFSIPKHRILNSTILIPSVIDLLWFSLKDIWVQFDFSNTFKNIIFISDFTVAIHFMISPFRVTFSKIHGTRILISCWLEKNNSLM